MQKKTTNSISYFQIEKDTFDFKISSSPTSYILLCANRFDYKEHAKTLIKLNETNGYKGLRVFDVVSIKEEAFVLIRLFSEQDASLKYLKKVKKKTSLSLVIISQHNFRVLLSGRRDFEEYVKFYESLVLKLIPLPPEMILKYKPFYSLPD